MSGVKRYQHIGSLVVSNEAMRSLYPMATQYVLASDYDTLRTANQRLEGEVARLKAAAEKAGNLIEQMAQAIVANDEYGDFAAEIEAAEEFAGDLINMAGDEQHESI